MREYTLYLFVQAIHPLTEGARYARNKGVVGGCNYRRLASDVRQTAAMRQDVVWWKDGRVDSPLYPAAKTTFQAPMLRVCAWTTQTGK